MSDGDFNFEPVRGLPAALPKGERLLWQGAPTAKGIAIRVLHVRKIAIYFAILMLWRFLAGQADGMTTGAALMRAAQLLPLLAAAIAILSLIAWGYARTTVYSLTDKRLVIRSGIALPITLNLPFSRIDSAALKVFRDGTGDIPLSVNKDDRIAVLVLWPHMRPWHWKDPQPMLRSIARPKEVAALVSAALSGVPISPALTLAAGKEAPTETTPPETSAQPA